MEIWLLVIILLVIAIILLVASLFVKNENDIEEHFNDLLMQQSQELNTLKQRIQELEHAQENQTFTAMTQDSQSNFYSNENNLEHSNQEISDVDEESQQTIITMYTQGFTMNEIKDELNLDSVTIQSIVDDYIENR